MCEVPVIDRTKHVLPVDIEVEGGIACDDSHGVRLTLSSIEGGDDKGLFGIARNRYCAIGFPGPEASSEVIATTLVDLKIVIAPRLAVSSEDDATAAELSPGIEQHHLHLVGEVREVGCLRETGTRRTATTSGCHMISAIDKLAGVTGLRICVFLPFIVILRKWIINGQYPTIRRIGVGYWRGLLFGCRWADCRCSLCHVCGGCHLDRASIVPFMRICQIENARAGPDHQYNHKDRYNPEQCFAEA